MSRRRFDRDFYNFEGPEFHGSRDFGGIFSLAFSMISLGLNIAFNILGIVLHVFLDLAGSRPVHRSKPFHQETNRQEAYSHGQTTSGGAARTNTETNSKKGKQHTIKKERVKETFDQGKEEHTSDWNILLFVLTLIPVIVTLAMKRLDLTGLVLLGGTVLIVVYNLIRNAVIRSKKKKQKQNVVVEDEKKEDVEIERVIKEAFDKVFAIRKEMYRISKQDVKVKLEGLCNMAEKIIGEVRTNPEALSSVRKFFYYYLDAFTEVFEKYVKLSSFSDSSEEVQKLLAETEKSFDDMGEIFQEMCESMLEKDMLNLKATINVIKNSNYSN